MTKPPPPPFPPPPPSDRVILAAGALAGIAYELVSFPFETACVLLQMEPTAAAAATATGTATTAVSALKSTASGINGVLSMDTLQHALPTLRSPGMVGMNTVEVMRAVMATSGVRGLYRGITPAVLRAVPAFAASLYFYEQALVVQSRMRVGGRDR